MPINQAKVKSVLSGDTLILASVNNPAQERTLSLAYVSAPRLKREGDEVSQMVCVGTTVDDSFTSRLHSTPETISVA